MVVGVGDTIVVIEQASAHCLQAAERACAAEKWTETGERTAAESRGASAARGEGAIRIELPRNPIRESRKWASRRGEGPYIRVCWIGSLGQVRRPHWTGDVDVVPANEPV